MPIAALTQCKDRQSLSDERDPAGTTPSDKTAVTPSAEGVSQKESADFLDGQATFVELRRPPHPENNSAQSNTVPSAPPSPEISQPIGRTNSLLRQPVRLSSPALKPPASPGPPEDELREMVGAQNPYPNGKPIVVPRDIKESGLRQFGADDPEGGIPDSLVKGQPGWVPKEEGLRTTHPEYADYKQRRPEQVLSHFSSVMLYHAKKENREDPVEVQYGYLRSPKGNLLGLYSSANKFEGQKWLRDNSGGEKLLNLVKSAALQDEKPDVKRHALKLLFFQENQQARRNEVKNSKLSEEDKKRLLDDLDQTDRLHKEFFTGTHHVVTNSIKVEDPNSRNVKARYLQDRKVQRHAEQNIAELMHMDAKEKGIAEIAGTKIRCGSCNSALGAHTKDEKEGVWVNGQFYPGHSSKSSIEQMVIRGRGSTRQGDRSRSTSRGRLPGGGSYYDKRDDRKKASGSGSVQKNAPTSPSKQKRISGPPPTGGQRRVPQDARFPRGRWNPTLTNQ